MDLLYRQRLSAELDGAQPGGAALIAESRDRIEGQVASQQREIEALQSRLR